MSTPDPMANQGKILKSHGIIIGCFKKLHSSVANVQSVFSVIYLGDLNLKLLIRSQKHSSQSLHVFLNGIFWECI